MKADGQFAVSHLRQGRHRLNWNIKDCTEAEFEKTVNAGEKSYQDASGAPLSGPHDIKITDTAPGTSGRAVPQNGREYSLGVICASESI
jgi:hypothetical protein